MPANQEQSVDETFDESHNCGSIDENHNIFDPSEKCENLSLEQSLYIVGYEKPWLERSAIHLNSDDEGLDFGNLGNGDYAAGKDNNVSTKLCLDEQISLKCLNSEEDHGSRTLEKCDDKVNSVSGQTEKCENLSLEQSLYIVGYEKPWLDRSAIHLNSDDEGPDLGNLGNGGYAAGKDNNVSTKLCIDEKKSRKSLKSEEDRGLRILEKCDDKVNNSVSGQTGSDGKTSRKRKHKHKPINREESRSPKRYKRDYSKERSSSHECRKKKKRRKSISKERPKHKHKKRDKTRSSSKRHRRDCDNRERTSSHRSHRKEQDQRAKK